MKIKPLLHKFQSLRGKRILTKLGIPLVIGLLVAFAALLFARKNILEVRDSDILYVKKGLITPGIVRLTHTPGEEFSFFINVYITYKQGQRSSFTVLADHINKISFLIRPDGIPVLLFPNAPGGVTGGCKVSRDQWQQVGFVYKDGQLTTFVNGCKCREALTVDKTFTLSHMELLPGSNAGKAAYPILLARALSLPHILELRNGSRLYHNLTIKIFLIFFFGFLVSFFVLIQLILPFISLEVPGFTAVYQVRRNVLFVFSVHFIFFLLFNLGYSAARHISLYFSKHRLWNPSAYFTFLLVTGFVFLLSLALGKITRAPAGIYFLYGCGVMSLLMFNFILCLLPRFNDIYPFVFNGLFSLLFSLVIAAPGILWVLRMAKVDDETGQAVHQA